MKYLTLLLLALFFLISCQNSPTESQAQTSSALAKSNQPPAFKLEDELLGYYVKTAHDGAWLLFMEEGEKGLKGSLTQYQGMLPPAEFLDGPDAEADIQEKHLIEFLSTDKNSGAFQSNVGSGRINANKIMFDSIIDLDAPLVLVREATYPRPE
ncbi:MAG: hypothetical protein R8P61_08535 [Bacteroidia bacterium]|nr:hypothetical protein [Bacteroidia bacterium]